MKKMQFEIAAGKAAIHVFNSKDVAYRGAMIDNIEKNMRRLRDVSSKSHLQSMEGAPESQFQCRHVTRNSKNNTSILSHTRRHSMAF